MKRDLQVEIAALRRTNWRMYHEVCSYGNREVGMFFLPSPSDNGTLHSKAGPEPTSHATPSGIPEDDDCIGCSSNAAYRGESTPGSNGRLHADITGSVDVAYYLQEFVRSVSTSADRISNSVAEDLRKQHDELGGHLERLSDELGNLRMELTAGGGDRIITTHVAGARSHSLFQPLELRDPDVVVSYPFDDASDRSLERPQYYLPLVAGIGVLIVTLMTILYITV